MTILSSSGMEAVASEGWLAVGVVMVFSTVWWDPRCGRCTVVSLVASKCLGLSHLVDWLLSSVLLSCLLLAFLVLYHAPLGLMVLCFAGWDPYFHPGQILRCLIFASVSCLVRLIP